MKQKRKHPLFLFLAIVALALTVLACGNSGVPSQPPITAATPIPVADPAPRGGRILGMDVTEAADGDFDAALDGDLGAAYFRGAG